MEKPMEEKLFDKIEGKSTYESHCRELNSPRVAKQLSHEKKIINSISQEMSLIEAFEIQNSIRAMKLNQVSGRQLVCFHQFP